MTISATISWHRFCRRLLNATAIIGSISIGALALSMNDVKAGEEAPEAVSVICENAEKLLKRFYPKVSIDRSNGLFVGKFDTRKFMIHHALKTGEWQEAREEEGPNRAGIICSIQSQKGRWGGAAVVPQTFNNRYFESLLMAPYSKKLDRHLVVHLSYPDGTKAEFLTEFQTMISSFSSAK